VAVASTLMAIGCGNDPTDPSDTTTTTAPGAPDAQRYIGTLAQPPPQGNLPLDLSLFFGLPRANGSPADGRPAAIHDVTGGYNTGPGSFSGSISGQLDGSPESGTFTGVITARLANGCEARRNYSGPISRTALNWVPGSQIETCGGTTPLTATVNPAGSTLAATTSTTSVAATTTTTLTATLTGIISSAATGQPIVGATVQIVGGGTATTNTTGAYTINNAPSGARTVSTSASGFVSRTDSVTIAPSGTTTFSTALVPATAGGAITIVLTWGAQPTDLDSYLTGPTPDGGRFQMSFFEPEPTPYVSLDVDDTTSFGPETTTIRPNGNNFVPGSYTFFVDNFTGVPGFDASDAVVTVFQSGTQLTQFRASAASGTPTNPIWAVFTFTLTATTSGQIAITPIQQFRTSPPSGLTTRARTK
jgi:hypothetical protein